jgi:nucleoid-associated protein YgaU
MRAALLTTALVIAALAIWASLREPDALRDVSGVAGASARLATPDVAARGDADGEPTAQPSLAEPCHTRAARPTTTPREHTVADGDTLASIAERYYSDIAWADDIYEANRDQIRDPARLHAGQTLLLP